ncbi:lactonase family protein [Carboxylicivirga sp. M1479]|uniref:lactonase family protein n=1 Tax=Carboxylicivirga sp. M1479 TaxID=2594476 RepID=UPI0011783C2E|nr:lactonase family protein [Carboxylicivirga sp. M1479]TRX62984.1 lactonase family protein [Carboxylicivirga sp. M1479]
MIKLFSIVLTMSVLVGCQLNAPKENYAFYLGTYTDGDSKGIYKYELDNDGHLSGGELLASTTNPSFLAFANEQTVLLAVNETDVDGSGGIESYQINDSGLTKLSSSKTGGAHPCHLDVNKSGKVLVANYTGGNIGQLQVSMKGELSPLVGVAQHTGQSITPRQEAPHAHSIWFTDEKKAIAVDLGIDQLIFYELLNGSLKRMDSLKMEAGAGPRHLTMHPKKEILYVINELNSTVSVVSKKDGKWRLHSSLSTLPEGYAQDSYCADIHISPDGRFLYASNRGHNSLAIYQVSNSGLELSLLGHEAVRGEWPRNFALTKDGAFLVVANQHSNNLVAFKRDENTGLLLFKSQIKAFSPVCVLFE